MREYVRHAHTIDSLIAELTRLRELEGGDAPIIVDLGDSAQEYSPVGPQCVYVGMYWAECTWGGDAFLTPEERAQKPRPDEYDEAPEDAVRAVFIAPTN